MTEKKKFHELPPSYANLGFDAEPSPGPSAPPHPDGTKFWQDVTEPPPFPTAPPSEPQKDLGPPPMFYNPPSLVFEEIYEAVAQSVKNDRCYGKRFVNQMKLTDISNKGVFYYTLESFGEKRETSYREDPYTGGSVDGPENGRPPKPWSMTALPTDIFKDGGTTIQIPHTEHVSTCWNCNGRREDTCSSCSGDGYGTCWRCNGRGSKRTESGAYSSCSTCYGTGRESCTWCSGAGRATCIKCSGHGKMTEYQILVVTWKNHISEYVSDAGNIPNELILKAKGMELFNENDRELLPLRNAPDASVNTESARLLEKHKTAFRNERIIRQRHILRAVPYTKVTYNWKEMAGEFYVYGTDRQVYFENYPQQYRCCTC